MMRSVRVGRTHDRTHGKIHILRLPPRRRSNDLHTRLTVARYGAPAADMALPENTPDQRGSDVETQW